MATIQAQLSLYPLRQHSIGPPIREAVRVFEHHNVQTRTGEMSTLLQGEEQAVFAGLQEAFHLAATHGDLVMVLTISNACPQMSSPKEE